MHILYIASLLTQDGLRLSGNSLVRHLAAEHDVHVCGMVVPNDHALLTGQFADEVVCESDLPRYDVVYMEAGWNRAAGPPRATVEILDPYVRAGGQLIVADIDRNGSQRDLEPLQHAASLLGAQPRLANGSVRYLLDQGARDISNSQRFFTSQMRVSEWLANSWRGIDSVLTIHAIELDCGVGGILASGHPTTMVMQDDVLADPGYPWPWASVSQKGKGHVVVIGANVSHDFLVDACPDNARWISNLIALLSDRSNDLHSWTTPPAPRNETPARNALMRLLDAEESQSLERKSSFLTPSPGKGQNTPEKAIQAEVGKAIAALANTDGGHLIIGQSDDREILGLASDFAKCRTPDRDGFELRLTQYQASAMHPKWEVLGLRVHWLESDDKQVAVIEVPRSRTPVYVDHQQDKEVIFVRRGSSSPKLSGRALAEWLAHRNRH